jgi:predicted Na+-dependent transporter
MRWPERAANAFPFWIGLAAGLAWFRPEWLTWFRGNWVVLAQRHFPDPLSALPGAISSVVHCLGGSVLACGWRWRGGCQGGGKP